MVFACLPVTYERFQSPSFSTAKEVVGVEGGFVACTKKSLVGWKSRRSRELLYALFLTIVLIITTSSHPPLASKNKSRLPSFASPLSSSSVVRKPKLSHLASSFPPPLKSHPSVKSTSRQQCTDTSSPSSSRSVSSHTTHSYQRAWISPSELW